MSKSRPSVSIVMAEYQTPRTDFKEAVDSILRQSFSDFEFIIVDDSGENRVEDMLAEYNDSRIKVVKNPSNMGFVFSLNNGIRRAKSQYIVRMDTDDVSEPRRIEKLFTFIEEHPEYSVVSSKVVEFTGNTINGAMGKGGEKGRKEVMRGDVPVHAAAIMRKEDLEEIGLYKDYSRAEDLALWCELLLADKRLFMLDDILYKYRVNPNDYRKRTLRHRKGELKARLTYYPKLGANIFAYWRIIKSVIAGLLPSRLTRFYRNKYVIKGVTK